MCLDSYLLYLPLLTPMTQFPHGHYGYRLHYLLVILVKPGKSLLQLHGFMLPLLQAKNRQQHLGNCDNSWTLRVKHGGLGNPGEKVVAACLGPIPLLLADKHKSIAPIDHNPVWMASEVPPHDPFGSIC